MNNGPVFKYVVGYCWGTGPNTGDAEMTVEALDIIQAATIAKTKLKTEGPFEAWVTSIMQQD